ncbi:hypothetical protein LC613_30465 [Nostoc sphaeroides CHAB 2801]|uniref:hypothetical protein n=1 Tax=Nostoc sphaeroides TaxID=446679 RepID=UPI001E41EDDB|nr:hypothetical protein [Nostoc sphaeroides]MCC5632012.1 hypothetical protein [Nostoc sphaeroides CHAB 2801]
MFNYLLRLLFDRVNLSDEAEEKLTELHYHPLVGEHPLSADLLFDEPYSRVFGVPELCFFQKWMLRGKFTNFNS